MNTSRKRIRSCATIQATLLAFLLAGSAAAPCAWGAKPPRPTSQELPWGVQRIGADTVWGTTTGGGLRIAILNTGVDKTHPDLVITDGFNAMGGAENAYDDIDGHGTAIAGVNAARNNNLGVVGVGPELEIYAVKFREHSGRVPPDPGAVYTDPSSNSFSSLYRGLEWCLNKGAPRVDVICMSFGIWSLKEVKRVLQRDMPLYDPTFYSLLRQAHEAGIVLVAAAGNGGREVQPYYRTESDAPQTTSMEYDFPASYPEVIAVAATGFRTTGKPSLPRDYLPTWSNFGPAIALSAPGASIKTTALGGGYASYSGTSLASPHVAATAGLVLAAHGSMAPDAVLLQLTSTAELLSAIDPTFQYGAGLVDAENAVKTALQQ